MPVDLDEPAESGVHRRLLSVLFGADDGVSLALGNEPLAVSAVGIGCGGIIQHEGPMILRTGVLAYDVKRAFRRAPVVWARQTAAPFFVGECVRSEEHTSELQS